MILVAPPPVDETKWNEWCRQNGRDKSQRTDDSACAYGNQLLIVGKEMGCPVLDTRGVLLRGGGGGVSDAEGCPHLTDGVHLTSSGNTLIFGGLMDVVRTEFPHLAPREYDVNGMPVGEGVPMEGKFWTELC